MDISVGLSILSWGEDMRTHRKLLALIDDLVGSGLACSGDMTSVPQKLVANGQAQPNKARLQ